jgi:hypothetical protein
MIARRAASAKAANVNGVAHLERFGLGATGDGRALAAARFAARFVEEDLDAGEALPSHPFLDGARSPRLVHLGALDGLPRERARARIEAARGAVGASIDVAVCALGAERVARPLTRATVEQAVAHAREVQALVGAPLAATNPPVEVPLGDVHPCELLGEVARRAAVGVRLDLGRLLAHQVARGHAPWHRLDAVHDVVVALKIGAGAIERRRGAAAFVEGGGEIADETLDLVARLVPRCPRLAAVLLDARDADEEVVDAVARLLDGLGFAVRP